MKHKFITLGEIMLRLTPPDYEKIRTATTFEARYGGSEANVALSLANLGIDASFFTVVPDNSLGKSSVRMMRSNDVNCDSVVYSTEEETPTHRLGTYYLETGYGIRPSKVVYDRKHSAFSEYDFSKTDVKKLLEGYTWLHLSGITPALGTKCRDLILNCLKAAKEMDMTVQKYAVDLGRGQRFLYTLSSVCKCSFRDRAIPYLEKGRRPQCRRCKGWNPVSAGS